MSNINQFKSLLHKLIKEELEGGEEKPQGLEKINYDLVLEPADLQSALSALGDIKNYGIYANNLRDPKIITKIFGPSIPAQKANTAWRTWDTLNDEERFAKATDIRNRVPEAWKTLEAELADKYDEWQTENGEGSFIEFISTLNSTELRKPKSNAFFGSRGANYYPMKTPDNLKKYSGVMTKDKDYVVDGDKIVFPQKTNPFETKDYLTKVLKTIMGNAKLQYSISQREADDQPQTTSNTQGAVEKINFVKTFDSPELAKKFMKFVPKDFAPKTELDGAKVSVLDITDAQKKNLMATALKFIADNAPKSKIKESIHKLIQEVLAEGKFPDLTGDGKVTKADILKGRGVDLDEKKLTKAEKNKKEDIIKGLKKSGFKKDDPAIYAIATAKAKKLAENEEDVVDTVTLDIPLFIRMLEYAKEDAQTDMDLHDAAEKAIALNKSKEVLSMEDYNQLISSENEPINEALDLSSYGEVVPPKGGGSLAGRYFQIKGKSPYDFILLDIKEESNKPYGVAMISGHGIFRDELIQSLGFKSTYSNTAGVDVYIADGNYNPKYLNEKEFEAILNKWSGGLGREAQAQKDFYSNRQAD